MTYKKGDKIRFVSNTNTFVNHIHTYKDALQLDEIGTVFKDEGSSVTVDEDKGRYFYNKNDIALVEENSNTFTKHDTTKNMLELIEPSFILGVGEILTFGAEKYSPDNWKNATEEDIKRIKGALFRHWMAYLNGEFLDPETNKSHLYHIGCNAMFLDYFDRQGVEDENIRQDNE